MSYIHFLFIISVVLAQSSSFKPNIIIITVDDMGFHDIPYNGASDLVMPIIKGYAEQSSAILDNYYVSPDGYSSRAALLTGKHPAKIGYQIRPGDATVPYGLNSDIKLLPQYLKELGYATHAVGQWDLGFYSPSYLPTKRGYDTFYGSYLSYGTYQSHNATDAEGHSGLDLHNDNRDEFTIDEGQAGEFKTELYISKAEEIIRNHDEAKPLHLYIALQAAQIRDHLSKCKTDIPNSYYYKTESQTANEDALRKCYVALLSAIDKAYGQIMNALQEELLLINSFVIFTTTSGGPAAGENFNAASNAPFRGTKSTIWEGGIRGVSFVYSTLPNAVGRKNCLTHISDWLPTIMHMYTHSTITRWIDSKYSELYGQDIFGCLFGSNSGGRDAVIPYLYGNAGVIIHSGYKLLIDPSGERTDMDEVYSQHDSCQRVTAPPCHPKNGPCLIKLSHDKCERGNFAQLDREYYSLLKHHMDEFNLTVPHHQISLESDDKGNPANLPKLAWQAWIDVNSGSHISLSILTITFALILLHSFLI